jgi:hypothetical protein
LREPEQDVALKAIVHRAAPSAEWEKRAARSGRDHATRTHTRARAHTHPCCLPGRPTASRENIPWQTKRKGSVSAKSSEAELRDELRYIETQLGCKSQDSSFGLPIFTLGNDWVGDKRHVCAGTAMHSPIRTWTPSARTERLSGRKEHAGYPGNVVIADRERRPCHFTTVAFPPSSKHPWRSLIDLGFAGVLLKLEPAVTKRMGVRIGLKAAGCGTPRPSVAGKPGEGTTARQRGVRPARLLALRPRLLGVPDTPTHPQAVIIRAQLVKRH